MNTLKKCITIGALLGAGVATALSGSPAHASTPAPVTATTQVTDRPDGGHGAGGTWADDSFVRVLTISVDTTAGDCGTVPAGSTCYSGTIADQGTFTTIPNRGAPNPNNPATGSDATIGFPAVTGQLQGTYNFTFYASVAPSAASVPASENDNGSTTGSGFVSTGNWAYQAFPQGDAGGFAGGAYSWTYKTACEAWTDSSTNGDGNQTADGNITGKVCPVAPVVSGKGDVINQFADGLDVYRQADRINNKIISYPVTASDPAVQFDAIILPNGIAFEYAPFGVDSGLCVSEAVGSEPRGSAKTGFVLRRCFTKWETFTVKAASNGSFQLVNVATGHIAQPNGVRAQFTGVADVTNVKGSWFGWNAKGAVPAS